MSGVEAAGFILAVLPLMISAVEKYNESLDPVKSFIRWERELPAFIRKLRNQEVHYQQTLRLLLEPVTSPEDLAEMIRDPLSTCWKDEGITESLQDRLGDSFVAYQDIIRDVDRIMRAIASKLDLEKDTRLARDDLEAMILANPRQSSGNFEFKKRIKFGLTKKRIKVLLDELEFNIKELERFTDRGEKLEQRGKGVWNATAGAPWERLRQSAKQLHQAVTRWNCPCHTEHATNLELEQRVEISKSKRRKRSNMKDGISFTVSFTTFDETMLQWQEAEIKIDPKEEAQIDDRLSRASTRASTLVSFDVDEPEDLKAEKTLSASDLIEVDDICSTIKRSSRTAAATRIGFYLDWAGKLRGVYPADCVPKKNPFSGTVSLAELLNTSNAISAHSRTKLTRKDRYSLAVTLASSTLQLCSTPWLPSPQTYSASDILFVRTGDPSKPVDIEHPYLRQPGCGVTPPSSNALTLGFPSDNATLLALALLLLELYFGEPRTNHCDTVDKSSAGVPSVFAALATAQQWVTAERENLSAAFLQAVSHCLRCFADPRSSLADAAFLQAAVEEIVVPLQVELWSFLGVAGAG